MSQVVRAKNQIRAVLRENDIAGPKWLWSKKKLAWLESLELHPVARLRLELGFRQAGLQPQPGRWRPRAGSEALGTSSRR